jgi:soluble lytic murein transglycosylase-like protein
MGVVLLAFVLAGSRVAFGEEDVATTNTAEAAAEVSVNATSQQEGAWLDFALTDLLASAEPGALLSEADAEAYRTIFTAQAAGDMDKADGAIASLTDKRLMGHILYQRYLHPTAYRASYTELKGWLDSYADLPEAKRVHALALKRRPARGAAGLDSPSSGRGVSGGLMAAAVVGSTNSQLWETGLSAWKARDYRAALASFQTLARSERASPWDQAAGAFWTARCLTRLGQPAEVSSWLRRAAAHPRTFYGLIANRQLGTEASLNWDVPPLATEHLIAVNSTKAGHRALALLQIGQLDLAEAELRSIHPRGNDTLEQALVAIAATASLPNLALHVGTAIPTAEGALYDAALYPVPRWEPAGGYRVDRALIFALVRQESKFDSDAKSHAGATGLMQLMPATAGYMAGRNFSRTNLTELHDPELNLTLGQRYVEYLLQQDGIDGNLFYLLAAYNGGPGQVQRWKRAASASNDPLLFIESIPAAETRNFIERVLANYWIYQLQLGQPTPSLDAVAAGEWPMYAPADDEVLRVADRLPVQ